MNEALRADMEERLLRRAASGPLLPADFHVITAGLELADKVLLLHSLVYEHKLHLTFFSGYVPVERC